MQPPNRIHHSLRKPHSAGQLQVDAAAALRRPMTLALLLAHRTPRLSAPVMCAPVSRLPPDFRDRRPSNTQTQWVSLRGSTPR
eukprot:1469459-Prymnesium_polylepis.2